MAAITKVLNIFFSYTLHYVAVDLDCSEIFRMVHKVHVFEPLKWHRENKFFDFFIGEAKDINISDFTQQVDYKIFPYIPKTELDGLFDNFADAIPEQIPEISIVAKSYNDLIIHFVMRSLHCSLSG